MIAKAMILLLSLWTVALAQKKPEPFGLKLGVSTKEEVMTVIRKEGGRVVDQGYKVIRGNIVNPNVEGYEIKGLPIDDLINANFWLYNSTLYKIEYIFPLSMNKDEFYVIHKQLMSQYGDPRRYVRPHLADGLAE